MKRILLVLAVAASLAVASTWAERQRLEWESAAGCPVCGGTREHVLGCPEMDKPR